MIASVVFLIATSLAAPGEIHRCVGPDGRERFQDRPCPGAGGKGQAFKVDPSGRVDATALRQWLKQLPQRSSENAAPSRATPPSGVSTGAMSFSGSERQLASCSQFFLDCADDDAFRTDACVFKLPQCATAASGNCCPGETLRCYRTLRRSGTALAIAVRGALLDPAQPACAVAR